MEIKVDGRLLVKTLCERFKEEFEIPKNATKADMESLKSKYGCK